MGLLTGKLTDRLTEWLIKAAERQIAIWRRVAIAEVSILPQNCMQFQPASQLIFMSIKDNLSGRAIIAAKYTASLAVPAC